MVERGELTVVELPPVAWFHPRVLAQTTLQVLLSTVFERFADKRETEAALPAQVPVVRVTGDEAWVDYVSDVGDGFDATATVAHLLARETLPLTDRTGDTCETRRGSVLVMGGDEVYPYSSLAAYEERTIGPYRAVFPRSVTPHPTLVAIPGNHDWYDGLTAFLRVFAAPPLDTGSLGDPAAAPGPWIGGWRTAQRRSYFSVQLPHRWWLWGIDIQLEAYIDAAQLDYFKLAAEQLDPGDGVVLCCAKPSWLEPEGRARDPYGVLDFFEAKLIRPTGAHLRLTLAGDHHAYVRYAAASGEQKIMAGGGGAYLAATHHLPERLTLPRPAPGKPSPDSTDFDIARVAGPGSPDARYPSASDSRREADRFGRILWRNGWGFPALVGGAYGLWSLALPGASRSAPQALLAALAILVVFLTLVKLTKARGALRLVGVGHAAVHTLIVAALTYAFREPCDRWWAAVIVGVIGAVVGPLVFAAYLYVADRAWGLNTNELFAGQHIERYKCFVRLHVDTDGELVVRVVGIDDVCHDWDLRTEGTVSAVDRRPLATPATEITTRLVDGPVRVGRLPGPG